MAKAQAVEPVKLFVAILWSSRDTLDGALDALRQQWGEIDFAGTDHPFDITDYYEGEMGPNLQRRLITFLNLVPPEDIRRAKLLCNDIEDGQVGAGGGRTVNLDIGYLDHNKIVLASLKYAGQKIHLGDGVYADLIARFREGKYRPFEWTFPDFRDGRYDVELAQIRRTYLDQLRARRSDHH